MNLDEKIKLHNFLFNLLSDHKKERFDTVVNQRTRHITVVIEDIFQPHNASAVLRSADLFGIQDVHIIENEHVYQVNPDVALGAAKWINLHKYNELENNTIECFNTLKRQGYQIVATTPHRNDFIIEELPIDKKTALVFGTEKTGLSELAMENADAFVRIPMYGFTESFNISVSAALSLYSATSRMRNSDIDWKLSKEEMIDIQIEWAKKAIKRVDLILKQFDKLATN